MAGYDASPITGAQAKAAIEKTRAQAVHVHEYGAVGDGTTDDTAAIQSAVDAAGSGGAIEFGHGKTYLQKRDIVLGDCTLIGNGAWLKRADAEQTTLSSAASDGDTSIDVADAGALDVEPGDQILILDGTATYSGRGDEETSGPFLSGIAVDSVSGDTITLSTGIEPAASMSGGESFPSGSVVLKVFQQIQSQEARIGIHDLGFDGNRANNDVHVGWVANGCIKTLGPGSYVENCRFKEMPSECLFVDHWVTVANNEAWNLNGSFTHISSVQPQDEGDLKSGSNVFSGNRIAGACEVPFAINGHNRGVFEYSVNSGKLLIEGNYVDGCNQAFLGRSGSASELVMCGNVARNCNGAMRFTPGSQRLNNITVTGNEFETCLFFYIDGDHFDTHTDGGNADKLVVSGNLFVNTKVRFNGSTNVVFYGNSVTWEADFDAANAGADYLQSESGLLSWGSALNISVVGNVFEDKKLTHDVVTDCIKFNHNDHFKLKSDASTDTVFCYYNRNVLIADNQILNFNNGMIHDDGVENGYDYAVLNFSVKDNNVVLRDSASADVGIRTLPGMFVEGNHVTASSNVDHGIEAILVANASKDDVPGPVIVNNLIVGQPTHSIEVGRGAGTNYWNGTVANNVTDVAVEDNFPSQNNVSGNTQVFLTGLTYPSQPSRANTAWY